MNKPNDVEYDAHVDEQEEKRTYRAFVKQVGYSDSIEVNAKDKAEVKDLVWQMLEKGTVNFRDDDWELTVMIE